MAQPWRIIALGVMLATLGLIASLHGLNLVGGQPEMRGRLAWVVVGWLATGGGSILVAAGAWRALQK